jgi:hypothetical protein
VATKFVLYHKDYDDDDDDDYDVDDLNVSVEGRVNWAFHAAMNSKLWLQNI